MSKPRNERLSIGIAGAGSVGCWVGGRLVAAGARVTFLGRPWLRDELKASGGMTLGDVPPSLPGVLRRVTGAPGGDDQRVAPERLDVVTGPSGLAGCDVVLVCVKSAQSTSTAAELAGVLRPGTLVVSLQNGVRNADALRAELGARPVLGGIVSFNVIAQGGGRFRRATTGPLVIEESAEPRLARLLDALAAAGIATEVTPDIRGQQWAKLLMNLNNAVSALTDAPTRDLVFLPRYRRILAALIGEALGVMRAAGVRPARLGAIPPGLLPVVLGLPTGALRVVARAQLRIDPEARSSMWEDLTRGRLTEVDYLNGEIVRLAEQGGVAAPLNRRITALVHEAEQRGPGSPRMPADQLWDALHRG